MENRRPLFLEMLLCMVAFPDGKPASTPHQVRGRLFLEMLLNTFDFARGGHLRNTKMSHRLGKPKGGASAGVRGRVYASCLEFLVALRRLRRPRRPDPTGRSRRGAP